MISSFVDDVFKSRKTRKIFILTPERAKDLFIKEHELNIQVFFFDEAQVSEEVERGVTFDVLVRRVKKVFSKAKLIFAHPFVDNPDAQLAKHGFQNTINYSRSYPFGTVGKISVYRHNNGKYYYFSPYLEEGHLIKNSEEFNGSFSDFAFDGEKSVLVYVSKTSIYNGKFLEPFKKYISDFKKIRERDALEIINSVEYLLGADDSGHQSMLVSLLRKGVVIHHGSIPLEVRFLIEKLIRLGVVKICFATSTLAQGVNMPFDIVWLEKMSILGSDDQSRALSFKNLIGRAGRLSNLPKFDFGYIYTKSPKLFSERIHKKFKLNERSVLDRTDIERDFDLKEMIDSINAGTFDDEKQASPSKIQRLSSDDNLKYCKAILDIIFSQPKIKSILSGRKNQKKREQLARYFKYIFESSINRILYDGEDAIFSTSISIFLQLIQGNSFREIVGRRYSYISNKEDNYLGYSNFSQEANKLPNSKLKKPYPLFEAGTQAKNVSYDAIVFDTYDYIDQVLSFSLMEVFVTSFKIYYEFTFDERALKMVDLLRYGTNDSDQILLMRYGFPAENVSEIVSYIDLISEENISFKASIQTAPQRIKDMVEWYLP